MTGRGAMTGVVGAAGWGGTRHPCGEGWHDHLWSRRAVAERGVRAHLIVVAPPALDHDLCLAQAVEDLAIEQLVAEPGIEALDEAVLPWAAGGDVGGLGPYRRDPFLHRLGHELGAVVGADVARHAT